MTIRQLNANGWNYRIDLDANDRFVVLYFAPIHAGGEEIGRVRTLGDALLIITSHSGSRIHNPGWLRY